MSFAKQSIASHSIHSMVRKYLLVGRILLLTLHLVDAFVCGRIENGNAFAGGRLLPLSVRVEFVNAGAGLDVVIEARHRGCTSDVPHPISDADSTGQRLPEHWTQSKGKLSQNENYVSCRTIVCLRRDRDYRTQDFQAEKNLCKLHIQFLTTPMQTGQVCKHVWTGLMTLKKNSNWVTVANVSASDQGRRQHGRGKWLTLQRRAAPGGGQKPGWLPGNLL